MADLTQPVAYRGVALNTVTVSPAGIVGCTVDAFDYSDLDVRQFTEPLALADGLDVGGIWLGARRVKLRGTVYDTTRALAFVRMDTLDAAFAPRAAFLLDPLTFGYSDLTWWKLGASGLVLKTLSVRSDGLRVEYIRDKTGGSNTDKLAIQWSVQLMAKNPAIA